MAVKPTIFEADFPPILSNYDLGEYVGFDTFANGAGQTTMLLITTAGKFVLRYYENRTDEHVRFEVSLLTYLKSKRYPVPLVLKNKSDVYISHYKNKPYILLEYIDGVIGENPNESFNQEQCTAVVKVVAQLHEFTKEYNPAPSEVRVEYTPAYCWNEYKNRSDAVRNKNRENWLKSELDSLDFKMSLPKSICHADLNYGNFLFEGDKIAAVFDFDMSFRTYVIYDVANLLYWWTWPPGKDFDLEKAKFIINGYVKTSPLSEGEKAHIYDALKLIILLGISWSEEDDFESSKKSIEFLNDIGRQEFYNKLFI